MTTEEKRNQTYTNFTLEKLNENENFIGVNLIKLLFEEMKKKILN